MEMVSTKIVSIAILFSLREIFVQCHLFIDDCSNYRCWSLVTFGVKSEKKLVKHYYDYTYTQ